MTLLDEVRQALADQTADALLPPLRRGQGLEVADVEDAAAFTDRSAAAAVRLVDGRRLLVPLTRDGNWRRAAASDGMSLTALAAPAPIAVRQLASMPTINTSCERSLEVDMSNDVRVIDDSVVAKWQLFGEIGSLAGPHVVEHLAAAGFSEMPQPLATVTWHDELLASYACYLPGAEDGWEWMLRDIQAHAVGTIGRPDWPSAVGALTARMHRAAAQPTSVISQPTSHIDLAPLAAHYRRLLNAAEGLDAEMCDALMPRMDRFESAWELLAHAREVQALPIHGDLHAGQLLRWSGGLVVNDFDGNPLMTPEQRGAPGPTALDVAALVRSLDHVAVAAARSINSANALDVARTWAREARAEVLAAYLGVDGVPSLDLELLAALESLSPLHEAVYAATYLPRWRYVPLAVLTGGW